MFNSAEEYVLARLDTLEKERDERFNVLESNLKEVEASNADRSVIFQVGSLKAVQYEVISSYKLKDTDYGFGEVAALKAAQAMDDETLYEWATQQYGKSWCKVTPINRIEKEFNYKLYVSSGNGIERYASDIDRPATFRKIYDIAELAEWCAYSLDSDLKAKAIEQLRNALARVIDDLDEEEETEDE